MVRLGWLHWMLFSLAAATMLSGAGCSGFKQWYSNGFKVGPNYGTPPAPAADQWIDSASSNLRSDDADYACWWGVFHDPVLNQLVDTAYQQNISLKTAAYRILEAQAIRGVAGGNLFPQQQQAYGQYTRIQYSNNGYPFGTFAQDVPNFKLSFDDWQTGFNASWELDFWGRLRRGIEAADAHLQAQVEGYDNLLVILQADVATNYIQMRAFEERIALVRKNIDLQRRTVEIASARFKAGIVTELDVQQAKAALATTESLLPTLETGQRRTQNRLCILTGAPPRDLAQEVGVSGTVPVPPVEIVVGVPANLLRRRPDVLQAEREAAVQSARIGIAKAEFYPHIAITGTVDLDSQYLSRLFESGSLAGQLGPGFRWDILNYGRLLNNVRAQDARFQQAVFTYRDTVLRAEEEAENAISAFLHEQTRVKSLEQSAVAAARSAELALMQYEKGIINYQPVLDSERVLVQQQDSLTESRALVAANLVAVYRALAGGWTTRLEQPEATTAAPELADRGKTQPRS